MQVDDGWLRADAARQLGEDPRDVTATEVLGNIDAMVQGVNIRRAGGLITAESLLEAHRRLMSGTRLEEHGGRIRRAELPAATTHAPLHSCPRHRRPWPVC